MKKTMLLGMVLLTMVFGATGCGNKAEANVELERHTDVEIIKAMIYEDYEITADTIEVNEYTGDRYDADGIQRIDDEFVNYTAYDEDGEIVASGGVDLSWAEYTYCK